MRNGRLWSAGLSLLLAATIAGCGSDSPSSGSPSSSDPVESPSSGYCEGSSSPSTSSTQSIVRDDGVFIQLRGNASFRPQDETVIDVGEKGNVLYFSCRDGQKRPISIVSAKATLKVLPSERLVSQSTSTSYASSLWKDLTFTNVSAPADGLIAQSTSASPGVEFVTSVDGRLYYTPPVDVISFTGEAYRIKELTPLLALRLDEARRNAIADLKDQRMQEPTNLDHLNPDKIPTDTSSTPIDPSKNDESTRHTPEENPDIPIHPAP